MNKKSILGLLLTVAALNGCARKDEVNVKPAENALTAFLNESTLTTTSTGNKLYFYEFGMVFSASVAGKITRIGAKMPEPGSYRVIVWDFDAEQILRQKTVEQTAPETLTLADIESLALTPTKKYVVSVNNQSAGVKKRYYMSTKTGGGDLMPFVKGSILMHNSASGQTSSATIAQYPVYNTAAQMRIGGYPEFTFVAD